MNTEDENEPERTVWATHDASAVWDLTRPPPDWVSGPEELFGAALMHLDDGGLTPPVTLVITEDESRVYHDHPAYTQARRIRLQDHPRFLVRSSAELGAWPSAQRADPYAQFFESWVEVTLNGDTRLIGRLKRPLEAPEELLEVALNPWDCVLVRRWTVQHITALPDPPKPQ